MKFIGTLPDPYTNTSNHWILVINIYKVPSFPATQGGGYNVCGALYAPAGYQVGYFTISNWNVDTTTNSVYCGMMQREHILIPPGYTFASFVNCEAFELELEEVKAYI